MFFSLHDDQLFRVDLKLEVLLIIAVWMGQRMESDYEPEST